MNLPSRSQAVLLFTVSLGKSDNAGARPLSTKEWARLAVRLKERQLDPSALLKGDVKALLDGWSDPSINAARLEGLLDRGGALGLVIEKWQRAGLWIVTRSDCGYPERLKRRLRQDSPPVLFGCGNIRLLARSGIAVLGSRNARADDLSFAEALRRFRCKGGIHGCLGRSARHRRVCDA